MIQIVSEKYGLEGVGVTKQGGRAENQDDLGFADTPLGFLLVVCDGMGGGPGGKTASYIAKNTFLETVANSSAMASPAEILKMAVDKANTAIEEKMSLIPQLKGMGSTLVAVLVSEQRAFVVHLGDSRCYRLHGQKMLFRTEDHSLVGELVRHGALTEEEARTSPQSNVITRGLGSTSNHVAEIHEVPYRAGDRFVLCTDGVWGIMTHDELMARLTSRGNVSDTIKSLSEEIDKIGESQGNHHDNHTMIVVTMKQDSIIKDPMSKPTRILLGVGLLALIVSVIFNIVSFLRLGAGPQLEMLRQTNDSLKAALATLTIRMQADKEGYRTQIADIINDNRNVSMSERAQTQREKDSLNDAIRQQQSSIDSLRRVISTLRQQTVATRQPKTSVAKVDKEGMSARQLAQYCINRLNTFINDKEASKSTMQENEKLLKDRLFHVLDDVRESLRTLDDKTDGKYAKYIREILNSLKNSEIFRPERIVWKDERRHAQVYTNGNARDFINKYIIPKLEKIVRAEY